jgi:hypothetical protein
MHHHLLLAITGLLLGRTPMAAQQAEYDIVKGDKVIGRIVALKQERQARTFYAMTSFAQFDLVLRKTIRTNLVTEYEGGQLYFCHTSIRVNNNLRDSSHMAYHHGDWHRYVHPGPGERRQDTATWTTARMYFEEPVDQPTIYVESVLAHCPLIGLGGGRYRLVLPDKSENLYAYRGGVLHEVFVDRTLVDLVFRRR